jgi:hypothetical protein
MPGQPNGAAVIEIIIIAVAVSAVTARIQVRTDRSALGISRLAFAMRILGAPYRFVLPGRRRCQPARPDRRRPLLGRPGTPRDDRRVHHRRVDHARRDRALTLSPRFLARAGSRPPPTPSARAAPEAASCSSGRCVPCRHRLARRSSDTHLVWSLGWLRR